MSIISILQQAGASSTLIQKVQQYPQLASELQLLYTKYETLEASEIKAKQTQPAESFEDVFGKQQNIKTNTKIESQELDTSKQLLLDFNSQKEIRSNVPKSEFSISIDKFDDIGNVKVFNKTTGKEVPFNKFALMFEDNKTASIGFVERGDTLAENKGAAREAYKLLGEELHSQGIRLTSSSTLQAPGKKLWDDLVKEGYAEQISGQGYSFISQKKDNLEVANKLLNEFENNSNKATSTFDYFDPYTQQFKTVTATSPEEIQKNLIKAKADWENLYQNNLHDAETNFDADMNLRYGFKKKSVDYVKDHEQRWQKLETDLENLKSKIKNVSRNPKQSSKSSVESNAQGYNQASSNTHSNATSNSSKSSVKSTASGTTSRQVHQNTHIQLQQNSLSQFFKDKERLKAFDIETTSLLNKGKNFQNRAKVWQIGLAIDSDTQGISGIQSHTNPFFSFDKDNNVSKVIKTVTDARTSLRKSNGRFSEQAFNKGNFTEFLKDYNQNKVKDLDPALKQMFDKVDKSDVLVLQNMNFENKTLRSQLEMGLLSKETYEDIASKMYTVSKDKSNNTLYLFERPFEVQQKIRRADLIFNTEYMFSRNSDSFEEYKNLLNSAMSSYADIINQTRNGAVSVELMDITKSFLANAADKGYIEKESAGLGLSLDFLSKAMYGEVEEHTALSDANLTNRVFKDLWGMNEELIHGKESEGTKAVLSNIKAAQPEEVNKRFISTVRSVLDDFLTTGETNLSNRMAWYNPEVTLKEGNDIKVLPEVKTIRRESTKDIDQAMKDVLKRYSHFTENIDGFSREAYIDNLLNLGRNPNNGLPSLNDMFKKADEDYFEGISSNSNILNENSSIINPTNKSSVIKEETKSWFKGKKGLALGAIGGGLLYMAMQSKPEPIEKNTDNVSENFYDEQYLGSAFVDFRERNKHYMM